MGDKLNLLAYTEEKPHYRKMVFWRFLNAVLFPLLSIEKRMKIVRFFGAKTGPDSCYYRSVRIYAPWNLKIVNHVMIGSGVNIYNKGEVSIGENVIISEGVFLCTASHDVESPIMRLVVRPINIGSNVWIGAKATILPGVTIGEGAVVGACAVVAKDVPPWAVVVGNPAKVVKFRKLREDCECPQSI